MVTMRQIRIIFLSLIIMKMTGCAEIKQHAVSFWEELKSMVQQSFRQTETREEAIKKHGYKENKEYFVVKQPSLHPDIVAQGEKIKQELQLSFIAPNKETKFNIIETVNLSGRDFNIELSRKERQLEQGSYVSIVQIVIPKDLTPGDYKLITTVNIADSKKTVKAAFRVKRP